MCFLPRRGVTRVSNRISLTPQVSRLAEKMRWPAAAGGASPCISAATAWTTAAPSPAGRRTSACPGSGCATGRQTAGTGGTSPRSCAPLRLGRTRGRVGRPSSCAGTASASPTPGGVTTPGTAPTAAMSSTVVSPQLPCCTNPGIIWNSQLTHRNTQKRLRERRRRNGGRRSRFPADSVAVLIINR